MKNKLGVSDFNFNENSYWRNDKQYTVKDLIDLSKDLPDIKIPLSVIDLGIMPWGEQSIHSLAYHIKRMNDADLSHPVILDDMGFICDGWHRVLKAVVAGDEFIYGRRLTTMPESC